LFAAKQEPQRFFVHHDQGVHSVVVSWLDTLAGCLDQVFFISLAKVTLQPKHYFFSNPDCQAWQLGGH
jgi:hypothetical protein